MLQVALVEDSGDAAETVKAYLDRLSAEKGLECRLVWFDNPVNFLEKYSVDYDIIMLDIQMPGMNGMDLARKIRERNATVPLIFITNMAQYAIKGYEVDASDFIVKPVSYFDFALKFERVVKKLDRAADNTKIAVGNGGSVTYIAARDVRYIEVLKHRLKYYTADGEYETSGSLVKTQSMLEAHDFVRCNNYCLVNLRYVFGVKGYTLTLLTGRGDEKTEIMISQPRKKEFMQKLNDYFRKNN
ncbi:MAG: LytTR family DNA-binding domain-containing protein [Clostridia bacterium]|nr:LytTR family DNA-binding domain-containing protein [Clostridia bacterium]